MAGGLYKLRVCVPFLTKQRFFLLHDEIGFGVQPVGNAMGLLSELKGHVKNSCGYIHTHTQTHTPHTRTRTPHTHTHHTHTTHTTHTPHHTHTHTHHTHTTHTHTTHTQTKHTTHTHHTHTNLLAKTNIVA
jgi:hypothetical protein